jgi:beta-glucanase (GH16 family)
MKCRLAHALAVWAFGILQAATSHAAVEWHQVWADEFNYTGAPDPTKWGYEYGKVRNGEDQYYTNRPENVRVENGTLVIEARRENYLGASYTSASLQTLSDDKKTVKMSVTGGRLEVRAKLPSMGGAWPAFWTLGTNAWTEGWPKSGEIDVLEYVANTPYVIFGNVHYQNADGYHSDEVGVYDPRSTNINAAPMHAAFHDFRVDWYPDRIEWYVDNTRYHQVAIDTSKMPADPFAKPHYLLLNLAVGGSWGSPIDPNFTSQQYLVDYVRVSQQGTVPEPASFAIVLSGLAGMLYKRSKRLH